MKRKALQTLQVVLCLLRDPSSDRYSRRWLKSLGSGAKRSNLERPWVTFKAMDWLDAYLKPDMNKFQYGSAGSTIYFSQRVAKAHSVEHDRNWFEKVTELICSKSISNVEYDWHLPEPLSGATDRSDVYTSSVGQYAAMSFRKYVCSIEKHSNHSFDLVFIDGRARTACVQHAIKKVRRGGHIMLDNSVQAEYLPAMKLLPGSAREDFPGVGPRITYPWKTTKWQLDFEE